MAINFAIVAIWFITILLSPFVITPFYICNKQKWCFEDIFTTDGDEEEVDEETKATRENFFEKYGTIFEGMKNYKASCLVYSIIFIVRRIMMVTLCLLDENVALQIHG